MPSNDDSLAGLEPPAYDTSLLDPYSAAFSSPFLALLWLRE